MPTQDFHLLQSVLLMHVIMFSHKAESFILIYCPSDSVDPYLRHFTHIRKPYDFSKAALVSCYISSASLLNSPSQFHNIDHLLYYHDHRK